MRKLILSICLVITGLILPSCNLDPVKKYDFTYAVNRYVDSKEKSDKILEYFKQTIGSDESFIITASRYDAISEALVKYQAVSAKIDDKAICSMLEKGEYVQLYLMMNDTKSAMEVVAYTTWTSEEDKAEAN